MWRRQHCEDGARGRSDASASLGATRSSKRPGESIPQSLQRERGPADTLILTSSLWNCERINFFCVQTFLTY